MTPSPPTSPLSLLDEWSAPAEPPRRSRGRIMLVLLLVTFLGAAAVWAFAGLGNSHSVSTGPPPFRIPLLMPVPRSAIPGPAATVPAAATLDAWIASVSSRTDIPPRVLRAYAHAETTTRDSRPSCHITWATVAGIGRIESLHGRHGGSSIDAEGGENPPVIGIPLDGSPGVQAVQDTDKGKLDGDPVWDHAVGPMQFLPATWKKWGVRSSDDGAAPDPQNIDDAALTTARYMCAKGGDLATPEGWWTAVLTYNNSTDYGQEVFSNADAYGKVSSAATG